MDGPIRSAIVTNRSFIILNTSRRSLFVSFRCDMRTNCLAQNRTATTTTVHFVVHPFSQSQIFYIHGTLAHCQQICVCFVCTHGELALTMLSDIQYTVLPRTLRTIWPPRQKKKKQIPHSASTSVQIILCRCDTHGRTTHMYVCINVGLYPWSFKIFPKRLGCYDPICIYASVNVAAVLVPTKSIATWLKRVHACGS